jgi:hypothetical protein
MWGQPKLTAGGREPHPLGNAWNAVPGGLFLGVTSVPTTGHFPAPQDQRNTVRGRLRCQVAPHFWVGGGIQFESGLPFHRLKVRFQIDLQNLTNVVDVIDFGGLFSENAIGLSRGVALRLTTNF